MMIAAGPLHFPAEIAALPRMDQWLTNFAADAGLAEATREELRVCLHELAANVIMHGGKQATHTISVSGHMDGATIVLEFADDAAPFDPLSRATGKVTATDIEDVAIGGLGLHLVRSFTDDLAYRRDGAWNRLTLVRGPGK